MEEWKEAEETNGGNTKESEYYETKVSGRKKSRKDGVKQRYEETE